jgi:hypothetical protein
MRRAIAIILTLFVLIAAPVAVFAGVGDSLDEQVNATTAAIDEAMVDEAQDTVDEAEEEPEVFDPDDLPEPPGEIMTQGEEDLVTYDVDGDEISNPEVTEGLSGDAEELAEDTEAHERAWDLFARISAPPYEDIVDQYVVFTDGFQNILAAVAADPATAETWTFYIDAADLEDEAELLLTVAHEYGHIVTLETGQIDYDASFLDPSAPLPDCGEDVALAEGCARPGSYYEAFNEFWAPIEAEHAEIDQIADEEEYYAAVEDFYNDHADEFVTPYSATNQGEDMAESFSYWMIGDDPDFGGVAQQKIEFWDQFPELVEMRANARDALGIED